MTFVVSIGELLLSAISLYMFLWLIWYWWFCLAKGKSFFKLFFPLLVVFPGLWPKESDAERFRIALGFWLLAVLVSVATLFLI